MSQAIERALRRQQAVQHSRGAAWVLFATLVPVALLSLVALLFGIVAGPIVSLNVLVSGIIAVSSIWIAAHLWGEARRLGKLLDDPESIMQAERGSDLADGLDWSGLIPFSGPRN